MIFKVMLQCVLYLATKVNISVMKLLYFISIKTLPIFPYVAQSQNDISCIYILVARYDNPNERIYFNHVAYFAIPERLISYCFLGGEGTL